MVTSSARIALLVLLVQLCAATSASASRPATEAEREAVSRAARQDPACVTVRVSDADPSWSLLYSNGADGCAGANGAVALQLTTAGWKVRYEGSGFPSVCPVKPLPTPVARDLGVCRPASKRVYVGRQGKLVYKPRRLQQGAHGFFDRLRWRSWGRATATATGVVDYADRYDQFVLPVRVTLSRIRTCGLKRVYTRIRIRFVQSSDRARAPGIPGTFTSPPCPF